MARGRCSTAACLQARLQLLSLAILVLTTGQGKPITLLRKGVSPGSPLTLAGRIIINSPGS